jgi:hypothetical protein
VLLHSAASNAYHNQCALTTVHTPSCQVLPLAATNCHTMAQSVDSAILALRQCVAAGGGKWQLLGIGCALRVTYAASDA